MLRKTSGLLCFIVLGCCLHTQVHADSSIWSLSAQEVRDRMNQKILAVDAERPEVGKVLETQISCEGKSIPVRIYLPNTESATPIALFIHGGGWVGGNLDTHDNLARYICRDAQLVVISVGYETAPENKFPSQIEQCYSALMWAVSHAQEWHADPTQVAVIGDSAGGNMAAALCLMARDRKEPHIDLQILINPAPDLTSNMTVVDESKERMQWMALQYVQNPDDVNHPYASPIVAKDLSNLPPALILLAENDVLFEDGRRYAERLKDAGVHITTYIQKGIGHLAGDGARASKQAQESLDVAVTSLRKAFHEKSAQLSMQ